MKYSFNPTYLILFFFLLITCPIFSGHDPDSSQHLSNQNIVYKDKIPALFASDEIIELTFKTDLNTIKCEGCENKGNGVGQ